jgi:hypothetical protein
MSGDFELHIDIRLLPLSPLFNQLAESRAKDARRYSSYTDCQNTYDAR